MMNVYKITQQALIGYDTFDSAVVVAESEDAAKLVHPISVWIGSPETGWPDRLMSIPSWPLPKDVRAELIGPLEDGSHYSAGDVILASFNAG